MRTRGRAAFAAAMSFVGCRFRIHGRDPATGIDCVGLIGCALSRAGCSVQLPPSYRLRHRHFDKFLRFAEASGLVPISESAKCGDVILFQVGPSQGHLGLADGNGAIVHAHAGLGRVVHGPASAEWSVIQHWRLACDMPPANFKE